MPPVRIRFGALAFSATWITLSAAAPCAAANITRYDLRIEPSFADSILRVEARIEIDNPDLEREFTFGLNDRYRKVEVTTAGERFVPERGPGIVTVRCARARNHLAIAFSLEGNLGSSNDERRAVCTDSSLFLLWSDRFYPEAFDDWARVRTTLVLPRGFEAIAPGRLRSVRDSADRRVLVFETRDPTVCFSVFADRRWRRVRRTSGRIPMTVLLHPECRRFADQIFRTSAEVLRFYGGLFGPYPFEEFAFVTVPGMYARRAFPGWVAYSPGFLEREFTTTGHDAHETMLLWWGYTTRGTGPGSWQWSEGLGDYAEILFDEATSRPIPEDFARFRDAFRSLPDSADVPIGALTGGVPQVIVHGKYPWLMHLLRFAVGDSAFRRGVRLLFDRYRHRTYTLDEFVRTLEQGTGQPLNWWREDWLERPGVPEVELEDRPGAQESEVEVELTQGNPPRRFPVEIGFAFADSVRRERIEVSETRTLRSFTFRAPPKGVVLDPSGWVPRRVPVDRR